MKFILITIIFLFIFHSCNSVEPTSSGGGRGFGNHYLSYRWNTDGTPHWLLITRESPRSRSYNHNDSTISVTLSDGTDHIAKVKKNTVIILELNKEVSYFEIQEFASLLVDIDAKQLKCADTNFTSYKDVIESLRN